MLIKRPNKFKSSEITPEPIYRQRRELVKAAIALGLLPAAIGRTQELGSSSLEDLPARSPPFPEDGKLVDVAPWPGSVDAELTAFEDVTGYNNYYEFGTGKTDPARNAHTLVTDPWTVTVDGEAEHTGTFALEDLISPSALEERVYRFRCVEAWSMVVPWVGFPLGDLLKRFSPTSRAKYVQFFTLNDPEQMPGVSSRILRWPYREGLTMAEAMHPLTLMAVGLYGQVLPNQNGAPLRLVVPWKYGFKSIKSIVAIRFSETRPATTWNMASAREYGFYSNVNPNVDHPRWSQASERPIRGGVSGLFSSRVPTLMFNGYAEEVAHLYSGLDLVANF